MPCRTYFGGQTFGMGIGVGVVGGCWAGGGHHGLGLHLPSFLVGGELWVCFGER